MTFRDEAIVLRTRPLGDADRQYVVFTKEHGKLSLIASGSRRSKSKMAPHMASIGVVDVMVARGRRVDRLAGAELVRPLLPHSADPGLSAAVQTMLLCVDELIQRELPEPRIFALLERSLSMFASWPAGEGRPLLFNATMFKMLDLLGFGLELSSCVRCRQPLVPGGNAIDFLHGGVLCGRCRDPLARPVTDAAIKAMRFFRQESLASVAVLRLSPGVRAEADFLVDMLLQSHVHARFKALDHLRQMTR